jgi:hypothetical protein
MTVISPVNLIRRFRRLNRHVQAASLQGVSDVAAEFVLRILRIEGRGAKLRSKTRPASPHPAARNLGRARWTGGRSRVGRWGGTTSCAEECESVMRAGSPRLCAVEVIAISATPPPRWSPGLGLESRILAALPSPAAVGASSWGDPSPPAPTAPTAPVGSS